MAEVRVSQGWGMWKINYSFTQRFAELGFIFWHHAAALPGYGRVLVGS